MNLQKKSEFNRSLRRIQLFGWWKIESTSVSKRFAYGIYRLLSLSCLLLYALLEVIDIYYAASDLGQLTMNLCGTFVSVVSIIKTMIVLAKAGSVEDLYRSLMNNLYVPHVGEDEADRWIIVRGSDNIVKLTKMFSSLVIPTVIIWSLMPFIDDSEDMKLPLRMYMPLDWHSTTGYVLFYLYQVGAIGIYSVNILSQDLIIFGFIIQICSQYEILENNLKKLEELCADEPTGSTNEKTLITEIKKSIAHHQQILRRIKQVQLIYQECLFAHFTGALPLLCFIGFNIISASKARGMSTHLLSQVGFIASTLFDLFLYCTFGERLRQKGLKIAQTVYDGVWYKVGNSPRRLLVLIMARAQNSPGLSAGHILTINLQSFLKLLRNAYNILAVMNQMSR